ncbi:hypothetical protein OG455_30540 [Kitasatospora sp. NBC_01287]|uniref:DUF6879 family protein n=1 Tax=Kitasatospora sp. NBC_01287 TaxID=2903573 RepID=UPI002250A5EA|nr:DUF6879 family protein [Kitasatospora sp. NBC_01287]MCX4749803.1 hypothetical protein [Kitasatospora sp. NBC_01287]
MTEFITDEQFDHLFGDGFQHTAWRLESRSAYASDLATPMYQRWSAGEDPQADQYRPWCQNIRTQVAAGKRIERVRVADSPLTAGQAFLLAVGWANVAAGEDIRHLDRAVAAELRLPKRDFWLFDSRVLIEMHFDCADEYLGAELIDDQGAVLIACQIRDAAWHHAVVREEFAKRVPSAV